MNIDDQVSNVVYESLYEFDNLIECMCAAAYMQIRCPVKIIELFDDVGGTIREKFVIPLTDPVKIAGIEKKIAEDVDPAYFIRKAKEYYEITNIDPLEAVVWLHWQQGYGIMVKNQCHRDVGDLTRSEE